jgi:hypothetical protein
MPRDHMPACPGVPFVGGKEPPLPAQPQESNARDRMTEAEPKSSTTPVVETPESTQVSAVPPLSPVALTAATPPRPISPPAGEPSALVLATIRWADLEAQMEYEYAKLCRLSEQQQCLRAEYQCLERLTVGIPSFQADYDAHVAATTTTLVEPDATSG